MFTETDMLSISVVLSYLIYKTKPIPLLTVSMYYILHKECIVSHYIWKVIISLFLVEISYKHLLLLIWKFCSPYFFHGC